MGSTLLLAGMRRGHVVKGGANGLFAVSAFLGSFKSVALFYQSEIGASLWSRGFVSQRCFQTRSGMGLQHLLGATKRTFAVT